jgi:hypothetical protein
VEGARWERALERQLTTAARGCSGSASVDTPSSRSRPESAAALEPCGMTWPKLSDELQAETDTSPGGLGRRPDSAAPPLNLASPWGLCRSRSGTPQGGFHTPQRPTVRATAKYLERIDKIDPDVLRAIFSAILPLLLKIPAVRKLLDALLNLDAQPPDVG